MKYIIATVALLFTSVVNAQHVELRVGSNTQGISYTAAPFYSSGDLSVAVESGYQRWKENDVVGNQLYVTPAVRLALTKSLSIEGGIGVSAFDRTAYNGKDISTRFQFADHLGVTYATKSVTLGVRYVHVSNAGIKQPNPGLDSVQASFSVRF